MATSLFENLSGVLRPTLIGATGAVLDEPDIGVRRGLEASFAAILGGLLRSSGDNRVMNEVADIVSHRDQLATASLDTISLLKSGPASAAMTLGNRLLSTLFGDRQSGIVRAIARASGISTTSASTLLAMAAPMVLGQLGRRTSSQGSTSGSLTALINAEQAPIAVAVPPYMRSLVGMALPVKGNLFETTLQNGLRSLLLVALTLLCVLGIFWYVLPPLQGNVELTVPEKPVFEGKLEIDADAWRRDTPSQPSGPATDEAREGRSAKLDQPDTSGSRTWTNPSMRIPGEPAAKAPPIAGLVRMTLPDGVDIDGVPFGVEQKMIAFLEDRFAIIDKSKWFDFDRLRFMSGSTELTPGSRAQLRNVAKIMKAYPNMKIKIGGYTDNIGDPASNMRLSDGRAKSVMVQLIKFGVLADRLEAEGYGEQHPVADNATAEGRAKNRRTALSIRAR
jgi:outer membrane protein OmpA-like peptidoglycan-associated protein